jgi:hypothetical protein
LGLGVDAPRIRVVIHVGQVRRLRDYSQESGRAGRDGGESEAIILNTASTMERCVWMDDGMKQYVWGGECRRVVLGRFMDGSDRGSCGESEQKCDVCGGMDKVNAIIHDEVDDGSVNGASNSSFRCMGASMSSRLRVEFEEEMQQTRWSKPIDWNG